MEFLNRVLGIRVTYQDTFPVFTPRDIDTRYKIRRVRLDGMPAFFVYPKGVLGPANLVLAHLKRIEKTQGGTAILVLNRLTHRQREYLLRDRIPFIVDGKQLYLPFLGAYLRERGDMEQKETGGMLPSAQLLLLLYLYEGCGEMTTGEAGKRLGFTATSVSRASRQLEEMGLIRTEKQGIQKVIRTEKTPEELFFSAKDSMRDPVKRRLYVPKAMVTGDPLVSGYSALSMYAHLAPPAVDCLAFCSVSALEKMASPDLLDPEDQVEAELWRYDPKKLSGVNRVDRLSLALSLAHDPDEEVQKEAEKLIAEVFRDIGIRRG